MRRLLHETKNGLSRVWLKRNIWLPLIQLVAFYGFRTQHSRRPLCVESSRSPCCRRRPQFGCRNVAKVAYDWPLVPTVYSRFYGPLKDDRNECFRLDAEKFVCASNPNTHFYDRKWPTKSTGWCFEGFAQRKAAIRLNRYKAGGVAFVTNRSTVSRDRIFDGRYKCHVSRQNSLMIGVFQNGEINAARHLGVNNTKKDTVVFDGERKPQ
jgi:hypothetical protein